MLGEDENWSRCGLRLCAIDFHAIRNDAIRNFPHFLTQYATYAIRNKPNSNFSTYKRYLWSTCEKYLYKGRFWCKNNNMRKVSSSMEIRKSVTMKRPALKRRSLSISDAGAERYLYTSGCAVYSFEVQTHRLHIFSANRVFTIVHERNLVQNLSS